MVADVKQQIADKYIEMIKSKSIDKVSVKDVVLECGVSRQTFYYHFSDVLDVLEYVIEDRNKSVLAKCIETGSSAEGLALYIKTYANFKNMVSWGRESKFRDRIYQLFHNVIIKSMWAIIQIEGTVDAMPLEEKRSVVQFLSFGVLGMFTENWDSDTLPAESFIKEATTYLNAKINK